MRLVFLKHNQTFHFCMWHKQKVVPNKQNWLWMNWNNSHAEKEKEQLKHVYVCGHTWTPSKCYLWCFPPLCRVVSSSWRTILSSSLINSGMRLSTPLRKTVDGCYGIWFATSSPLTSWSSPVVWEKGSVQSTQETRAWRDDRSTPSKLAASEVRPWKSLLIKNMLQCFWIPPQSSIQLVKHRCIT